MDTIPPQISNSGLSDWYASLDERDRVRVRRYLPGIDDSSAPALLLDLMTKAEEDHNFRIAVTAGLYLDSLGLDDTDRFRATESLIEGMFGCDMFGEAKMMCVRNLELYPAIAPKLFPEGPPKRMSCMSRLVDILVGIDADYDSAYRTLDTYVKMGLIDGKERDYRVQSLKIHRMQVSFDNIFNLSPKKRRSSTQSWE